jgi:hypothetical protein
MTTSATTAEEVEATNTRTTPSLADRRSDLARGYENLRYYIPYPEFHQRVRALLDAQRKALEAEETAARQQSPQPELEETRQPWWFSECDHYDASATS